MGRDANDARRGAHATTDFDALAQRSREICALVASVRLAVHEQRAQLLALRSARRELGMELASIERRLHASLRSVG